MCELPVKMPVKPHGLFCQCAVFFRRKEDKVKISRRLYRIGALTGAILLPLGAVLATGIPEASAAVGSQFCIASNECLNAWNGGPWVNVFTGGPTGAQNNYFQDYCFNGICQIVDTGPTNYDGSCVGDAGNSSGNADTALIGCTGWGTNFQEISCSATSIAFKNVHWGGYLGPPSGAINGSHWYLNKPGRYCFTKFS
jgi:hypothetical protein